MRLPISINCKSNIYDSILVIVDLLIKMVNYEPVKIIINILDLAKVILDVVIQHHDSPDLIMSDWESVFISKFWSMLYYFFRMKQKLSTTFHPQTHG